tara:strand:- start:9805 stop:10227 length:423 start_codon:yes stop_codon:yes gene_type:complete
MANFKKSWVAEVGLNHVPAYQASGRPFATASLNCRDDGAGGHAVYFPYVTRWVQIINNDTSNAVKVGFSKRGLDTEKNFFTIGKGAAAQPTSSERLELKVSELHITGSTNVDIIAGLTTIPSERTQTTTGPSWSGSAGVG